jgi:hypothetical protein
MRQHARPSAARQFSVVLEDIRSPFTVFGEALQGFREQVDRSFDRVEHETVLLKNASLEHGRRLKEVRSAVDRLTEKVDRKVDRAKVEAIVEEVVARPRSH